MKGNVSPPIDVFCCYARSDLALCEELKTHMAGLVREGHVKIWFDRDISPGTAWEDEISLHLSQSRIIFLLLSSDFLSSDYCYRKEMRLALERHDAGQARVIPILLRPCDWKITPLKALQVSPSNALPVTLWRNRDEAFEDIIKGIHQVVNELHLQQITAYNPPTSVTPARFPSHTSSGLTPAPQTFSRSVELVTLPKAKVATSRVSEKWAKLFLISSIITIILVILSIVISFQISKFNTTITHKNETITPTNPIATVFANETATPVVTTVIAPILPQGWKLALDDPLHDNTKGYLWDLGTGSDNNSLCEFFHNAYHVVEKKEHNLAGCVSRKFDLADFLFQVQMTITTGDCGGIFFRDTDADSNAKFYLFQACHNGLTSLWQYTRINAKLSIGTEISLDSESSAIQVNRPTMVEVLANESDIKIYLNQQLVYTASDSTFTHGYIAVGAISENDPTEVIYNNAKVWIPLSITI